MSATITSSVKSNLLALQTISSEASKIQNVLSTGKKVNSALDNATSFFTSSSLNSRATSLTGLLDGVSNGIQTIKAADSGISSITKLVDQLKSTAQQALATSSAYTAKAKLETNAITGATSADLRGSGTVTYTSADFEGSAVLSSANGTPAITGTTDLKDVASIADGQTLVVNGTTLTFKSTGATGQNEFDIGNSSTVKVSDVLTRIDAITGGTGSTVASGGKLKIATGTTSDLTITGTGLGTFGLGSGVSQARTSSGGPALDGKTLTFTVGSSTLAVKLGDPAAVGAAGTEVKSLDDLNAKLSTIGLSASLDSSSKLTFTTTSDTASKTFKVKADATTAGFTSGTDRTSSDPTRGGAGADSRDSLVTQYNGLLEQINTLAKDASYNGLNLLTGDTLGLVFNETNTSKLSITGQDATFTGLGLSKAKASDFNDGNGINAVLSGLEKSKTALTSLSAKLGANLAVVQTRQDFTKSLANNLTTGADNLVNADMNEEATKLLALQTSQSLAQSALSLSNQSAQGVLRLLQ